MAKVVAVVHESGLTARMTEKSFVDRFAAEGWTLADPRAVIASTDDTINEVLDDVGDDPVKAAAAIEVEAAGKNRPTLISKLAAIRDGVPGATDTQSEKE